MEGKIPDELASDYSRIPLIDLPPTGDDPVPEGADDTLDTPKSPPPGTPPARKAKFQLRIFSKRYLQTCLSTALLNGTYL